MKWLLAIVAALTLVSVGLFAARSAEQHDATQCRDFDAPIRFCTSGRDTEQMRCECLSQAEYSARVKAHF